MDTRCPQCTTDFRWTRPACPRCWHANGIRPAMLLVKLLALIGIGAVIALILQLVTVSTARHASPSRASESPNLFPTPTPSSPDPRFGERP